MDWLSSIALLFENVFGIRVDVEKEKIIWDIRLCEAHGINNYSYGKKNFINLYCASRKSVGDKPIIEISSNISIEIEIRRQGGSEILKVLKSRIS